MGLESLTPDERTMVKEGKQYDVPYVAPDSGAATERGEFWEGFDERARETGKTMLVQSCQNANLGMASHNLLVSVGESYGYGGASCVAKEYLPPVTAISQCKEAATEFYDNEDPHAAGKAFFDCVFNTGISAAMGVGAYRGGRALLLEQEKPPTQVSPKALPQPKIIRHHLFNKFRGTSPKSAKYRAFFKKHGIDIDKYTVEMSEKRHQEFVHRAGSNWTTRWKQWIDEHPNATTTEVYQFAGQLMDEYGLSGLPIVPYR